MLPPGDQFYLIRINLNCSEKRLLLVVFFFRICIGRARVAAKERTETLFEFRKLAFFHDLNGAAFPRRVCQRVDVEFHNIAWLTPCGVCFVFCSIGHHDCDFVVIRVYFGFHLLLLNL